MFFLFYYNIDPVLFSIGPLSVRYYGIIYALGLLLVYLTLMYAAKKDLVKNLTEKNYESVFFYLVISCIVGARLGIVLFYNPLFYLTHPLEIFMLWHGGLSFHGALIGLSVVSYYVCKKYDIKFYELADLLAIPAAFALCLGRIGNFLNGELIGTKTDLPICINYEGVDGCRHFSQIYESFKNLFIGFVLFFMYKSKKFQSGVVFYTFVFLYGLLRFLVNFFRDDSNGSVYYLGLSTGQYLSLFMVIVSIFWAIKNRHKLFKSISG